MILRGDLTQIKARKSVMDDVIQVITLEVHGDFAALRGLMGKTLKVDLTEDEDDTK